MAKSKIIFISALISCFIIQDIAPNLLVSGKTGKFINNNAMHELSSYGTLASMIPEEDKKINSLNKTFQLYDNFPNPFNPNTIIQFETAHKTFISLKVFNLLGNEIATLMDEEKSAGKYLVQFDGSNLTSGVYCYRLQAGDYVETKKMILLR